MCNCNKGKKMEVPLTPPPVARAKETPATTRSGACPYCLRKHLLKASGYAEELREDSSREWEREQLLKNLLLAEDHAEALGDWDFRTAIRTERINLENGGMPETEPLLARARAKILEVGGGVKSSPVVEKAETPA